MVPFSFLASFASALLGNALELSDLDESFFEMMGDEDLDLPQLRAAALYQMAAARLRREAGPQPEESQPQDELGHIQALDWSYDEPGAWTVNHPECGGDRQSPVAISTESILMDGGSSLATLLDYSDVAGLAVENIGTAIEVKGGFGTLALPDGMYEAIQFHFHFPAEHSVDGTTADGELHIVHQKVGSQGNDDLAVIGVLLTAVTDEEGLAQADIEDSLLKRLGFLSGLPRQYKKSPVDQSINLRQALQRELVGRYYHYQGSLTTPPCSESVHWYVLATPSAITQAMVDNFKVLFPDPMNNRPLQQLNDRVITSSLETDADEYGILSHAASGQ